MDVSSMNRTMPGAYGTDKAPKKMTDEKSAFLKAAKGAPGSMGLGGGMVMHSIPSAAQGPDQGSGPGYPTASPSASVPVPDASRPTPLALTIQSMLQNRIHGRPAGMPSEGPAYSEVLLKHDIGVAIAKGDTQAVEDLIKGAPHDFDINAMHNKAGGTTLHEAVMAGKGDIVRFLVDHAGIDMAKLDNSGTSAYQVADAKAKASGDPADRATADYLRGRMTDELKRAALDGNYNRADELVNAGADASILPGGKLASREWFTQPNLNFSYYLRNAITRGDTEAVQTLLKDAPKGWDINAVGTSVAGMGGGDATLLQSVARSGIDGGASHSNEDTIRALIDNDSIDRAKLDASGKSAYQVLEDRAKGMHDPVLQRDADFLRDKMNGELGRAVFDGDQKRATALLKAGADPKAAINGDPEKSKGMTLLMFAAANKEPDVVKAMLDALPPDERKAFVNQKGAGGNTALHAAAFGGDDATYKALVEAGGDETVKNGVGKTPDDIIKNSLATKIVPRGNPIGVTPPGPDPANDLGQEALSRLNGLMDGSLGLGPMQALGAATPDTYNFIDNPAGYAATHFLGPATGGNVPNGGIMQFNVNPSVRGQHPPALPALGGTAPGAYVTGRPDTGVGPNRAYWLNYAQNGNTPVDTEIRVPAHPGPNDPHFVMTPTVTGCAFYATPDPHNPDMLIFHHVSGPTDPGSAQTPAVPPGGTGIGYADYEPDRYAASRPGGAAGSNQNPGIANGVAPFAYYDDRQRQWVVTGQPFSLDARGNPPSLNPFSQSTGRGGIGGFTVPVVPSPPRP